ncbi:MAG: aminoacetone oxidase family FAD-binding enzyme, partial [Oscillospiraceae bacterium]
TNNCDNEEFLKNIPTNPRFLYSAINSFSCQDTMDFFESLGVKLKTERGNRVFPQSDKASEIVFCLENTCNNLHIKIIKDCYCEKFIINDNAIVGISTNKGEYFSKNILLCTGGKSYSVTGSDGNGYNLAQQCGHTIILPKPALVPIETKEPYPTKMMGLSLKNVILTVFCKQSGKAVFKDMGEMLFTHFGISGPLVLSASSFIKSQHEYDM